MFSVLKFIPEVDIIPIISIGVRLIVPVDKGCKANVFRGSRIAHHRPGH